MSPGWVKNDKKIYIPVNSLLTPFLLKTKFLRAIVSQNTKQTKYELTGLHKILQKFIFLTETNH